MRVDNNAVNTAGAVNAGNPKRAVDAKNIAKNHDTDTVEIRSGRGATGSDEATYAVTTHYPARSERVAQVRRTIEQGSYEGDVLRDVTERLLQSPAMRDVVNEVALKAGTRESGDVERLNDIRERSTGDHYDRPEVMRDMAGRLIDALGIMK